jgi:hypothetical protein
VHARPAPCHPGSHAPGPELAWQGGRGMREAVAPMPPAMPRGFPPWGRLATGGKRAREAPPLPPPPPPGHPQPGQPAQHSGAGWRGGWQQGRPARCHPMPPRLAARARGVLGVGRAWVVVRRAGPRVAWPLGSPGGCCSPASAQGCCRCTATPITVSPAIRIVQDKLQPVSPCQGLPAAGRTASNGHLHPPPHPTPPHPTPPTIAPGGTPRMPT